MKQISWKTSGVLSFLILISQINHSFAQTAPTRDVITVTSVKFRHATNGVTNLIIQGTNDVNIALKNFVQFYVPIYYVTSDLEKNRALEALKSCSAYAEKAMDQQRKYRLIIESTRGQTTQSGNLVSTYISALDVQPGANEMSCELQLR